MFESYRYSSCQPSNNTSVLCIRTQTVEQTGSLFVVTVMEGGSAESPRLASLAGIVWPSNSSGGEGAGWDYLAGGAGCRSFTSGCVKWRTGCDKRLAGTCSAQDITSWTCVTHCICSSQILLLWKLLVTQRCTGHPLAWLHWFTDHGWVGARVTMKSTCGAMNRMSARRLQVPVCELCDSMFNLISTFSFLSLRNQAIYVDLENIIICF